MARARNIKPGFFKNELLAEIHPLGRILFAGLWIIADREGRMEDRPKRIKAEILPYDDCDVDKLLDDLANSPERFIIRYKVNGAAFIAIPTFNEHQNPHMREAASTIPAPDEHSACTRQAQDEHRTSPADSPMPHAPCPHVESLKKDMSIERPADHDQSANQKTQRGSIKAVMDYYNQIFSSCWAKPLKLTTDRRAKISVRLKVFSVEDLCRAIDNIRGSGFHCGDNDKGQVYASPEFIFRNDAMVDKWLNQVSKDAIRANGGGEKPEVTERKRQETIAAACSFIRVNLGDRPPPDQAEQMAREYDPALAPEILKTLYGGEPP